MALAPRRRHRDSRPITPVLVALWVLTPCMAVLAPDARAGGVQAFSRREVPESFEGSPAALQTIEKGVARPVALATADLDEDGIPDLIAGYDSVGSGVVSVRFGNPDALYPNSPGARERRARGTFTDSPFLVPARLMDVPETPDFIATGDFDADDHQDLLLGARGGSRLYFLKGDGRGNLASPRGLMLPGALTSLATGELGRPLGLPAVVAGVDGEAGPRIVILDSPTGAVDAQPAIIGLPARATALLLGRVDDDDWIDLAVAAGSDVWVLGGRDRTLLTPLTFGQSSGPSPIRSMALGDFDADGRPDLAELTEDGALWLQPLRPDRSESGGTSGPRLIRAASAGRSGGALLVRGKFSGHPGDDLVIFDDAGRGLAILAGPESRLEGPPRATGSGGAAPDVPRPWGTVDLAERPIAAVPMRLGPGALNDLVVLQDGGALMTAAPITTQATLTVTNTNDTGAGSLRQAILDANTTSAADTISFGISGTGPFIIQPHSALPSITFPVTLDATTQPGFAGTPIVQIDGTLAGNGVHGLVIAGGASTVRGLVIGGFGGTGVGDGLHLQGAGTDVVENNYIGTDVTGTAARPNTGSGVVVDNIGGCTIGGTLAAARNLLSGNTGAGVVITGASATSNIVEGNLIGTRASGSAALGNGTRGVFVDGAPGNTIGISNVLPNVISGNNGDGVVINGAATGSLIRGNYVGVDITNKTGVRNSVAGIRLLSSNATVGGNTVGQRNSIGFNGTSGVVVVGGTGNRLMRNGIYSDLVLGIDLGDDGVTPNDAGDADGGANLLQNYPVLTSAVTDSASSTITGTFNSKPATTYTLEIYTSPSCDTAGFGEGKQFFTSTSLTTDAAGNAPLALSQPLPLPVRIFVTATASDPSGNTSEFSNCVRVSDQTPAEVGGESWTGTTQLSWTAVSTATSYNVYRGRTSFLPNLVNSAQESCLRAAVTTTTTGAVLAETPVLGSAYWYLIAGVNSFGEGSVGDATPGPRVLDSFGNCPTCAHEKCVAGGPLTSGCDPCVTSICAANPSCCSTQWTSSCVAQVLSVCGSLECSTSAGACPHQQCIAGGGLPNTCDSPPVSPSCVDTVCGTDPVCCTTSWDSTCVEEVGTLCSKTCN